MKTNEAKAVDGASNIKTPGDSPDGNNIVINNINICIDSSATNGIETVDNRSDIKTVKRSDEANIEAFYDTINWHNNDGNANRDNNGDVFYDSRNNYTSHRSDPKEEVRISKKVLWRKTTKTANGTPLISKRRYNQ